MKGKGFTLIELLIVLAIIAILAVILILIIKPGQIFIRARDTQRIGDLRNLSQAVDAYLIELAQNPAMSWPARGGCTNSTTQNIFFSVGDFLPLTGWPDLPLDHVATGTTSQTADGNGWVPLNFNLVSVLNLSQLPLDPRNGQTGADATGQSATFAYSFACDTNYNYEFAAKLEGNASAMANDGGNRNDCPSGGGIMYYYPPSVHAVVIITAGCLYEVGPGKAILY
jgi:prepilin-type N-terminal cleavage/methylation domain-containing protein